MDGTRVLCFGVGCRGGGFDRSHIQRATFKPCFANLSAERESGIRHTATSSLNLTFNRHFDVVEVGATEKRSTSSGLLSLIASWIASWIIHSLVGSFACRVICYLFHSLLLSLLAEIRSCFSPSLSPSLSLSMIMSTIKQHQTTSRETHRSQLKPAS